jgi:hypothetical protein
VPKEESEKLLRRSDDAGNEALDFSERLEIRVLSLCDLLEDLPALDTIPGVL